MSKVRLIGKIIAMFPNIGLLVLFVHLIQGVVGVRFTNVAAFSSFIAGEPFTFTWEDAVGPVTVTLMNGAPPNMQKSMSIFSK
jgi:hypothetical protein